MKISVIITVKEDRGYLQECIDSVKKQILDDYEIILASDNNAELRQIAEQSNILFSLHIGKSNFASNANTAVKMAKGDYIKFIADDDKLTSIALKELYKKNGCDVVFANYILIENGFASKELKMPYDEYNGDFRKMLIDRKLSSGTALIKRESLLAVGGFDENFNIAEGYILFSKMIKKGIENFNYIDKNIYLYRIHNSQKSLGLNSEMKQKRVDEMKIIESIYGCF